MRSICWFSVGLSVAWSAGCNSSAPPQTTEPQLPAEASFSKQVANVRAGKTDRIDVRSDAVTVEELAQLQELSTLTWLRLEQTPVTDEGVATLLGLRELEILNLPQAQFTDAALAQLKQLPKLELLQFGSPNVTDAGIAHIRQMPKLRFLHLIETPITDAGLKHLHGMTQLESFYIDGGDVTEAGLKKLQDSVLPMKLHMHVSGDHLPGDPNADDHK
jgi:hypothetical protein